MASYVGISPKNPTKYLGPNVYTSSIVVRNREPGGSDIKLPTTGAYYPIGSFWIISKNPVSGTEGDLWYLSKIVSNVAYWELFNNSAPIPVFPWYDMLGAFTPDVNSGYFITGTATATLPAAPDQGDTIQFFVDTSNILTIQASGAQTIRLGIQVTAGGGTAVNHFQGDTIELTYRSAANCWAATPGSGGSWTLT